MNGVLDKVRSSLSYVQLGLTNSFLCTLLLGRRHCSTLESHVVYMHRKAVFTWPFLVESLCLVGSFAQLNKATALHYTSFPKS